MVSMVTLPLAGAVHLNQTEAPPALPAWFGSLVSLEARKLVLVTVPCAPLRVVALAKLSLAGMVTMRLALQTPQRPERLVIEPTAVVAYSWIVQKSESLTGSTHVML